MLLYQDLSDKIIAAFYEVAKHLPAGMEEKVYERALIYELRQQRLHPNDQQHLTVTYKGMIIGEYIPDILVDDKIILELKAVNKIAPEHKAQLINYLAITGIRVGYVLNFGDTRAFARLIRG